jgi:DNA-binding transcriptional LysR family regulator
MFHADANTASSEARPFRQSTQLGSASTNMSSEDFRDIVAFLAVAQERSFTRAAARLGVSPSAVSHTVRALETRLGLRLLTRTTRSVAPTEAGQRLVESVGPRFEVIAEELDSFSELRDKPAGVVRITTSDFAYKMVLWPRLSELQPRYPISNSIYLSTQDSSTSSRSDMTPEFVLATRFPKI